MYRYGLIGKKLGHSFSKTYFNNKFENEGLTDHRYDLFEIPELAEFPSLLNNTPELKGLNVTIPYKKDIIKYLTILDKEATAVGAVNTIKINQGELHGFNTDIYGFERSLKESCNINVLQNSLILGTGGASKAVEYVLNKYNIETIFVSRTKSEANVSYKQLNENPEILKYNMLIVNTTPLGMYPDIDNLPPIPYHHLTPNHILFDLVYNPEKTSFLAEGERHGAKIKNGLDMLHYQAERAWQIWNDTTL